MIICRLCAHVSTCLCTVVGFFFPLSSTSDYGVKKFVDVANQDEASIDAAFKAINDHGAALAPKFEQLKELAEQIRIARSAKLDASELEEEFAKLRPTVDQDA